MVQNPLGCGGVGLQMCLFAVATWANSSLEVKFLHCLMTGPNTRSYSAGGWRACRLFAVKASMSHGFASAEVEAEVSTKVDLVVSQMLGI